MKILNHKQNVIKILQKTLDEFNKLKSKKVSVIIKGSYVLKLKNIIDRTPNDIDLFFLNNENLSTKREFIHFLTKKLKANINREDDNLITIQTSNYGKIEFILFESIDESLIEKIDKNIFITNIDFLFLGKIFMLNYVMSKYYLHNDKNEKIQTTLLDLINISKKTNFFENYQISHLKKNIYNLINNSTFIYIYYKYEDFLWWKTEYLNFELKNEEQQQMLQKIALFFEEIDKDQEIKNYIELNKQIIKSFYDGFINQILEKYNTISPSGNEQIFINQIFDNITKSEGAFKLENNNSNLVFLSRCDEVMEILLDGNIYNSGNIIWQKSNDLNVFDSTGKLISENLAFKSNDDYVFSAEKNIKINKPRIELINHNLDELFSKSAKTPFYVVSNEKPAVKNFNLLSRNHDNKINVFVLKWLRENTDKVPNIFLTSSEEIGLKGIKETKKLIGEQKICINLEVSQWNKWENHNLLIRVADSFTPLNNKILEKVTKIFEKFSIPYKLYYVSDSTDISEISESHNGITIAIPADSIHTMKSRISILNLIYMMKITRILNEEFNKND